MTDIVFNNAGVPLMGYSKKFFFSTTGAPAESLPISKQTDKVEDSSNIGSYKFVNWGDGNNFPGEAADIIGKTGVLNTALKLNMKVIVGQGIFPCKVTGYDEKGNEQLEVLVDPELIKFIKSRKVRRYMEKALRDILKYGQAVPELIPNEDGSMIVGINTVKAKHTRFTEAKNGTIENCIVSGKFPDTPSDKKDFEVIPVLDDYDPLEDLERRRYAKQVGGKKFIYRLVDDWSDEDYYPFPDWWTAYRAGWIAIANQVPTFLKKAYDNQITWLWHVKIPYAYWDKRYPKSEYKDDTKRQAKIQEEMDEIEKNLTSVENANKALFSMYEIGRDGKPEEQWIIESLDNKYKEGDKLFTSAAANSEILFSLMINPNLLGAGMPGGTYAGNQGGSNIREAFLVNLALCWLDRQRLLDPIETMLAYNGHEDVELRFRQTILTTLDSGAGTDKNLA